MPANDTSMNASNFHMQARLVRRAVRRFGQMARFRRLTLAGVPVLLANSFPKSGTHLLTQVLQGFPVIGPAVDSGLPAIVTYEGDSGRQRQGIEILADLQRLKAGDLAYGHIHALPEVVRFLCQPGYAAYFILRDPRDVVVSHVHYVTEMEPNHIHHRYYSEELHSFDERLAVSILGRPDVPIPFPDIQARFEPYLGWLDHPEVLVLHFEDFIQQQEAALERVLDHAVQRGFPMQVSRPAAIQALAHSIDPQRSPTFRSGKVGGWRDQFSTENKRLFKQVAGELLLRLGYEQGDDW
jgi:Sulfotransferase domain